VTDFLAGVALRGAGLVRSVEPRPVSEDPLTPLQALESEKFERGALLLAPAAALPAREAAARPESPDDADERSRETGLDPGMTASPAETHTGPPTARPTSSPVTNEGHRLRQRTAVADVPPQTQVTRRPAVTRTSAAPRVRGHEETGDGGNDTSTVRRTQPRRVDGAAAPGSSIPESTLIPAAPTPADGTRPETVAPALQRPPASSVAPLVSPAPSAPIAMPLPPRQAQREEPAIEVRVGRVEIRAAVPPRPVSPAPRRAPRGFQERLAARRHADRRWY
jgi:hypothetical protein